MKYFSKIAALYADEYPSKAVADYTKDFFLNPNRILTYFERNFNKFDYFVENISQDCNLILECRQLYMFHNLFENSKYFAFTFF